MKNLYFIRHGQSTANIDGVWGADTNLTEKGLLQAKQAAQHAKEKGLTFDLIISSSSIRALDTAKEVALATRYPIENIVLSNDVKERYFGELDDVKVGDELNKIHGTDETYIEKFSRVESMVDLQTRADKVLALLRARPEETILVASHSAFGRAMRRAVDGKPYTVSETAFVPLPNAEIIKLI